MQYRPYQRDAHTAIFQAWQNPGVDNVLAVMPTGAGKSLLMGGVMHDFPPGKRVAIAHRKELVGQIAMALATCGVKHNVIGPTSMVKYLIHRQRQKLGTHFFDANADATVASVDTINAREESLRAWGAQVRLWETDEAHHLLRDNKWGKAVKLFPNAKGLGVTATPCRADGKGIGARSDGVFHDMVVGPTMRDLIRDGYLCDYKIFAPLTYMPLSLDDVGASGDYSSVKLRTAAKNSTIVGDVVASWFKIADGKQTLLFAPDLETAAEMAANFSASGVRAELISGETPDDIRTELLDQFERKVYQVVINVDLMGEGFDCPGIEVVIFARKTESYGLYVQHFGRALRTLLGKPYAIIIDHVGNVKRHGLPDAARLWSLDGREKRPRAVDPEDEIPLRYCTSCTQPYLRIKSSCPWCGHVEIPDGRSRPEMVDGDLYEMDEALLMQLRGEVSRVDESAAAVRQRMLHAGAHPAVAGNVFNMVTERARAQSALRESIAWWAAMQFDKGRDDRESYKLFYHLFGIDVLSAKALGMQDAYKLANRVNHALGGPEV
jgi:DNA repair protein RadD